MGRKTVIRHDYVCKWPSLTWGEELLIKARCIDLFARQLCLKQPGHNIEVGCPNALIWPREPQHEPSCAVWMQLQGAGTAPGHSRLDEDHRFLGEIQLMTAEPGKWLPKVTPCAEPAACHLETRKESCRVSHTQFQPSLSPQFVSHSGWSEVSLAIYEENTALEEGCLKCYTMGGGRITN